MIFWSGNANYSGVNLTLENNLNLNGGTVLLHTDLGGSGTVTLSGNITLGAGTTAFRSEYTVDRQTEVIDATFFEPAWIFRGRDTALEQELIRRFKKAL